MGYALLSARELSLTNIVNSCNAELLKISQERMDLHKYGSSLASGIIPGGLDIEAMAGMPMSMRGLALQYATFGHQQANVGALMDTDMLFPQLMNQMMQNPYYQQAGMNVNPEQIRQNIFQQALRARLAETKKAEEARIKAIEDELDMKQKKIETRLQAAEKELQSVEKGKEAAINRATPKYA